ncbi:hypothetical protein JOM56_005906 [Amanita muscaria]
MENEFDNIQDDIANLDGVDWDQVLLVASATSVQAGNALREASPEASNLDFSDEVYDLDTLEEIAVIERRALSQALGTSRDESGSTSNVHASRYFPNLDTNSDEQSCPKLSNLGTPKKKKRKRKVLPTSPISPSKKRSKTTSSISAIDGFADELTCPICCDIFVAAYAANPCGHSFCGPCGDEWTRKNRNNSCPICRTQLARDFPLIPNISLDNVVEKYITLLAQGGSAAWSLEGEKFKEWYSRKAAWKVNNQTRTTSIAVNVVMYSGPDDFAHLDVHDFDISSPPTPPNTPGLMQINFNPGVGQRFTVSPLLLASHISSYAAVRFTAVLDDGEYEQISRDGGKLQLWSNNPSIDGSEWQEHDFTEDTNTSHAENLTPGGRRLSLCLSVVLPRRVDEVELSYTYRISCPDGRVKWLGKYGQNGICVVHRQGSSHIILGDRWYSKDNTTFNLDAGESSKAHLNVLGGLDPSTYHLHAFDADGSDPSALLAHSATDGAIVSNCSLLFIVPKHAPDSHILPQAFVISSSLGNSISLSATGDVTINDNAKNSLLFQVYDPRTDLRSVVEAAITHSMSGKIRALSIDHQNRLAVLATAPVHHPMRLVAIGLSPESNIQSTEVELEQRDLENLFTDPVNSICAYPPFQTGADQISRDDTPGCDAKRVSVDIGTRYILSPEYHLRCQGGLWRISVLSDHTNVRAPLEQPNARMLPTPPASPKVPAERPGALKGSPSPATGRAQLAKRIAKAMVTYVRYWFALMFFPITIIFHILSILRRETSATFNNAKKDPESRKDAETRPRQTVAGEEYAGRAMHCRNLSLRVLPGQLTILLRPGAGVAAEDSKRVFSIRFDGEELSGFVEQHADEAILLTTFVDKEGDVEICAV